MFLIAAASIAGVASAGRNVTIGTAPSTAALPARPRNWRRVVSCWCTTGSAFLFAQAYEICHDVFDLFRQQDRSAAPCGADAHQSLDAIVGRHDGRGIEPGCVHQPKPKLAFGPAAAGAAKPGPETALKLSFPKCPHVPKHPRAAPT